MTEHLTYWFPPGEALPDPIWIQVNPFNVFYIRAGHPGGTVIIGSNAGPNSYLHVNEDAQTVRSHFKRMRLEFSENGATNEPD